MFSLALNIFLKFFAPVVLNFLSGTLFKCFAKGRNMNIHFYIIICILIQFQNFGSYIIEAKVSLKIIEDKVSTND